MSVRSLTQPNNTKLYLNTVEGGINVNGTIVKNQQEDNEYTYVLPERPTVEGQPQVMVSTLTGDIVDTTWVSAGDGVIPIPDPLVVDELRSQNIINDVNIQTDTFNTKKINFDSDSNPSQNTTIEFTGDGGNDINYLLPPTELINENEQYVMIASRSGITTELNFINTALTPLPSPKTFFHKNTTVFISDPVSTQYDSIFLNLLPNTNYKITWGTFWKANGAVPVQVDITFTFDDSVIVYQPKTPNTMVLNSDVELSPQIITAFYKTNLNTVLRQFRIFVRSDRIGGTGVDTTTIVESYILVEPILQFQSIT